MMKEIYNCRINGNEYELALNNIENALSRNNEFLGDLAKIKELVDKYTLQTFLINKGFKKVDSDCIWLYEDENGSILVVVNELGNKINQLIHHQKTNEIMKLGFLLLDLKEFTK